MRRKGSEKNAYMQEKCVIYEHSHQNLSYMFFFWTMISQVCIHTTPLPLPYHSPTTPLLSYTFLVDSLLLLVASDDFAIVLNPLKKKHQDSILTLSLCIASITS